LSIRDLVRRRATGTEAHYSIEIRPGLVIDHEIDALEAQYVARWRAMGASERMVQRALLRAREWAVEMAKLTLGDMARDPALLARAVKAIYPEALESSEHWLKAFLQPFPTASPESIVVDGMIIDSELTELERRMAEQWRAQGYPEMAIRGALGWAKKYVAGILGKLYPGPENRDLRITLARQFYERALTQLAPRWLEKWYKAMFE